MILPPYHSVNPRPFPCCWLLSSKAARVFFSCFSSSVACICRLRGFILFMSPQNIEGELLVYAISDVHTDYPENAAWVSSLPATFGPGTVLIVAGDVSDDLRTVRLGFAYPEMYSCMLFSPAPLPCFVHTVYMHGGLCFPRSASMLPNRHFDRA